MIQLKESPQGKGLTKPNPLPLLRYPHMVK